MMNKIIECVPNFSNGRDPEILEKIVAPFRGKENVKLWITNPTKIITVRL